MTDSPQGQALCPRCGYLTLSMSGGVLLCETQACGYEHDVTGSIPIVPREDS